MVARCPQHFPRLGPVHRHARFAKNMLAGLERGDRERRVHVGPGADADRIHRVVREHFLPVGRHVWDPEFIGDLLRRRRRPVCDGYDLDAFLFLETGNVAASGIAAGADQADATDRTGHGLFLLCRCADSGR